MTTPRHLPPLDDEERAAFVDRLVDHGRTPDEAEAELARLEAEAAAAIPDPAAGRPLA